MYLRHAAAGLWRAVSGSYMYGGKVHPAHRSVLCDVLEAYFCRAITNVLDMLIENRELINTNVHNF